MLTALADPNAAFLGVVVGLLAVYFELILPGAVLPGAAGGVLMAVCLYALAQQPWQWDGAVLIAVALPLLLWAARGGWWRALGVLGYGCLVAGAGRLIEGPVTISPVLAALAGAPAAALTTLLAGVARQARANKSL